MPTWFGDEEGGVDERSIMFNASLNHVHRSNKPLEQRKNMLARLMLWKSFIRKMESVECTKELVLLYWEVRFEVDVICCGSFKISCCVGIWSSWWVIFLFCIFKNGFCRCPSHWNVLYFIWISSQCIDTCWKNVSSENMNLKIWLQSFHLMLYLNLDKQRVV